MFFWWEYSIVVATGTGDLKKFRKAKYALQYAAKAWSTHKHIKPLTYVQNGAYTEYTMTASVERTMKYVEYLKKLWPTYHDGHDSNGNATQTEKHKQSMSVLKGVNPLRLVIAKREEVAKRLMECMTQESNDAFGVWVTRDVIHDVKPSWLEQICQMWYLGEYVLNIDGNSESLHVYDMVLLNSVYTSAYTAWPSKLPVSTFGYKHAFVGKLCVVSVVVFGYAYMSDISTLSIVREVLDTDIDNTCHNEHERDTDHLATLSCKVHGMSYHNGSSTQLFQIRQPLQKKQYGNNHQHIIIEPIEAILNDLCMDTDGIMLPFDHNKGAFTIVFPNAERAMAWAHLILQGLDLINWDPQLLLHPLCEPMIIKGVLVRGPKLKIGMDMGNVQIAIKDRVSYKGAVLDKSHRIASVAPAGHIYCTQKVLDALPQDGTHRVRLMQKLPPTGLTTELQLYDIG